MEAVKAGMEQLHKAEKSLKNLQSAFASIIDLCAECDRLIENQEKIQLLSTVNTNLSRVITEVEVLPRTLRFFSLHAFAAS